MTGSTSSAPLLPADGAPGYAPGVRLAGLAVRHRWTIAVAMVAAIGLLLRLLALADRSLTWDETYSVFIASQPASRVLLLTALNEAHPPLHYLLLRGWILLFGSGEAAVRALSVPIGFATVVVTWLFGRRLLGNAAALVAAGLVAIAPSQVAVGQEARMYGLLALAAISSWWALWAGLKTDRRGPWVAYTLTVTVMLYVHYYGFFVAASHALYLVWQRQPEAVWRRWLTAVIGITILYAPWAVQIPGQLATGRAWPGYRPEMTPGLYVDTLTSITIGQLFLDAIHGGSLPREISWSLTIGAGVVAALGYRSLRGQPAARALIIGSVFLPLTLAFAVSYVVNVFAPRYLTFLMPGLALLAGAGVTAIAAQSTGAAQKRRWAQVATAVALAVFVTPNVASLVRYYQLPRLDYFDWRKVAQTLAGRARSEDAIVFLPGFSRIAVNYYYPGPQPRLALTPDGDDVVGARNARLPEITEFLSRYPRVWVVSNLPLPPALNALMASLSGRAYALTEHSEVNVVRLFLLERPVSPAEPARR